MTTPDYLRELGTMRLPDTALPCRQCGRAVLRVDAGRVESLTVENYRPSTEDRAAWERHVRADREAAERWASRPVRLGDYGHAPPPAVFEFATCSQCAATLERIERLAAMHRAAVVGIPSSRLAVALFRLDMLAHPLTDADADAMTGAGLRLMLDRLGLGALPRWADRFHPVHRGGDPRTCAPEPWAHVPAESRTAAASARRAWEAARLAARRDALDVPRPVLCPSGACVLCGIASVDALRRDAYRVWAPFRASVAGLGGRGPGHLEGHLCVTCSAVFDAVGGAGPTLLERSLFAHLDSDGSKGSRGLELEGLTAWAVTGAKPNAKPWVHVRASDAVTARLLGQPWGAELTPRARELLASVAGHVSDDAVAELRAVLATPTRSRR